MLFDAALSSWLHGRRHTMTFHGPPDTRRMLAALLTQMYDKDIEWRSEWEPAHGGWAPTVAQDAAPGVARATADWRVLAEPVVHGHGLDVSQAFLERWICYGYRVETQSKVIAISGDTVDCAGLHRIARDADVLVRCGYLADAEIASEHFRRLARYTLAAAKRSGRSPPRAT